MEDGLIDRAPSYDAFVLVIICVMLIVIRGRLGGRGREDRRRRGPAGHCSARPATIQRQLPENAQDLRHGDAISGCRRRAGDLLARASNLARHRTGQKWRTESKPFRQPDGNAGANTRVSGGTDPTTPKYHLRIRREYDGNSAGPRVRNRIRPRRPAPSTGCVRRGPDSRRHRVSLSTSPTIASASAAPATALP